MQIFITVAIVSRLPDGFAAGFLRSTEGGEASLRLSLFLVSEHAKLMFSSFHYCRYCALMALLPNCALFGGVENHR